MWFIAILGLGALLLHKKNKAANARAFYALPPPQQYQPRPAPQLTPGPGRGAPPSPIMVLGEFIRQKRQPPPFVIQCAIAEAEQSGRHDITSDIIRMFVEPAVRARYAAQGMAQPPAMPAGAPVAPGTQSPQAAPQAQGSPRNGGVPGSLSDAQIQAMLDTDPAAFMARVQRGDVIDVPSDPEQPGAPEVDTDQRGADQVHSASTVSGTTIGSVPTVLALPSPIHDVDTIRWNAFCNLLAREEPTYVSARHVGVYRQNKDRLRELQIDPSAIVGSHEAQRLALDRDLADAHVHAREGGLSRFVGRHIAVPGSDDKVAVTLSGVLGVIQAAGLDGAAEWLDSWGDRKRFRHTTQAFLRTNGVF